MKKCCLFVTSVLGVLFAASCCNAGVPLRVTRDRVTLRAAPDNASEMVGRVSTGDLLSTDKLDGDWIAVVPPSSVDLWVYGELVKDGVVAVSDLRVRSGPGINYPPVGRLEKGRRIDVRGVQGDWIRIAPLDGCLVWISRDYVEDAAPAKPEPKAVPPAPKPEVVAVTKPLSEPDLHVGAALPAPRPIPKADVPPQIVRPHPYRPVDTPRPVRGPAPVVTQSPFIGPGKMVASKVQGEEVSLVGMVRRSGWVWRRPSQYRLVQYDDLGRAITACYVLGDEQKLERCLNSRVTLHGKAYWVQGVRHKVVVFTD